jgi:hypothetical protein
MSTTEAVKAGAVKNGGAAKGAEFVDFDKLSGDEIFTDRPVYKPETCGRAPIVGFVVEHVILAAPKGRKDAKPWGAFVILLTHPTLATDRDDNIVTIPAGREVFLPANVKLDVILKWAKNPDIMAEVAIKPEAKVDIGGGQTMWTFRQKVVSTKKREGGYLLAAPGTMDQLTDGAAS